MNWKSFLIFMALFLLCSCSNKSHSKSGSQSELEKIELSNGTKKSMNYTVSEFKTILLDDDSSGSLFSNIAKVLVRNQKIFILDGGSTHLIYVFDISGKFIRTIGTIGQGPGEYIDARDFTVKGDYLYVCNDRARKIMTYSISDGSFISEMKIPFVPRAFSLLNNGNILLVLPKDQNGGQIAVVNDKGEVVSAGLDFEDDDKDGRTRYNLLQEHIGHKFLTYNKPEKSAIYLISQEDGSVLKRFQLPFPEEDIYISSTPIVHDGYIMGNYNHDDEKYFYSIKGFDIRTAEAEDMFIKKIDIEDIDISKVLLPMSLSDDNRIVSFMDGGIADILKEESVIDDKTYKHLEDGGYALCLYTIAK